MTANEDRRHMYVGRLDRVCDICGHTDRDPAHDLPDTSPTPVDLDAVARKYRDYLSVSIPGVHREAMAMDLATAVPALIAELRDLRQFRGITLNEARNRRTRTSIGPDSERIREAEQVIADAVQHHWCEDGQHMRHRCQPWADEHARVATTALRAAGLLPGPDDIVVSREIADKALRHAWVAHDDATVAALRAALSQPPPEEARRE